VVGEDNAEDPSLLVSAETTDEDRDIAAKPLTRRLTANLDAESSESLSCCLALEGGNAARDRVIGRVGGAGLGERLRFDDRTAGLAGRESLSLRVAARVSSDTEPAVAFGEDMGCIRFGLFGFRGL
jgi:hypothetical protein